MSELILAKPKSEFYPSGHRRSSQKIVKRLLTGAA
jgi:hypothetical protein